MNCRLHVNHEAAGTCGRCGVGICVDCIDASIYEWENSPMCPDCNVGTVSEIRDGAAAQERTCRNSAIFFGIMIGGGIISAMVTGSLWSMFGWFATAGFLTAWKTSKQRVLVGSLEGIGMALCLKMFTCSVVGAILAPIVFVKMLISWRTARQTRLEAEADLAELQRLHAALPKSFSAHRSTLTQPAREPLDAKERRKAERRDLATYFGPWKRRGAPTPGSRTMDANHSRAQMSPVGMRGVRQVHVISNHGRGTSAHNGTR